MNLLLPVHNVEHIFFGHAASNLVTRHAQQLRTLKRTERRRAHTEEIPCSCCEIFHALVHSPTRIRNGMHGPACHLLEELPALLHLKIHLCIGEGTQVIPCVPSRLNIVPVRDKREEVLFGDAVYANSLRLDEECGTHTARTQDIGYFLHIRCSKS